MPKIIYIVTRGDTFGGVQTHVRDLAQNACSSSFQTLVAHGPGTTFQNMLEDAGVRSTVLPHLRRAIHPYRDICAFFEIIALIRREQPTLVSLHTSKSGVLGRLACAATRTPCIFTAHGWSFTRGINPLKRLFYLVAEKITLWPARRIICVSRFDLELARRARVSAKKLVVIHNAVADPGAKQSYASSQTCRAVMVGRIDPQKDHRILIEALRDIPGLSVTFIGTGSLEEDMKQYARERGVYSRTIFLGEREKAAELLKDFDLFILTSRWEGFPRSTLEALASGLPVVISNTGGANEAITDGIEGFVVPPGDSKALAEKLTVLVSDPEKREAMGRAARARYEREFALPGFLQKTCGLYQEVLQEQR